MLAVVGGWFSKRRSMALGIAVAGIGVGTLGVSPLAAALIDSMGWRATYRLFAVASAVLLVVCALASSPPPRPAPVDAPGGRAAGVRSPAFVVLYVSMLLVSAALFMVFIFLVPFAEEHGVGNVAAATLMGIVGASSILGRLLLGTLADRLGAIRTYRACFLAIALTYVLWLSTTTYPWLLTFSILYGVAYGGVIALSPAVMADVFGSSTMGRLIGVLYTSAGVGALVGAPLAGYAIDRTDSYRWAIGLSALLALVGWFLLRRLSGHVAVHHAPADTAGVPLPA
jgi:predicted MFS family arabinose efflux permease